MSSIVSYVKLDSETLEAVLTLHERYAGGIAGGKRASLKFVDFSGIDLSGRNLADAELTGCVFENAKLIKTIFERAILFACDFRKADLRGARMAKADMRGANLRGADLSHADLTQSDFREGEVAVADKKNGMMVVKHRMRPGDAEGLEAKERAAAVLYEEGQLVSLEGFKVDAGSSTTSSGGA